MKKFLLFLTLICSSLFALNACDAEGSLPDDASIGEVFQVRDSMIWAKLLISPKKFSAEDAPQKGNIVCFKETDIPNKNVKASDSLAFRIVHYELIPTRQVDIIPIRQFSIMPPYFYYCIVKPL